MHKYAQKDKEKKTAIADNHVHMYCTKHTFTNTQHPTHHLNTQNITSPLLVQVVGCISRQIPWYHRALSLPV